MLLKTNWACHKILTDKNKSFWIQIIYSKNVMLLLQEFLFKNQHKWGAYAFSIVEITYNGLNG